MVVSVVDVVVGATPVVVGADVLGVMDGEVLVVASSAGVVHAGTTSAPTTSKDLMRTGVEGRAPTLRRTAYDTVVRQPG